MNGSGELNVGGDPASVEEVTRAEVPPPWWLASLRCPDCRLALDLSPAATSCAACGWQRPRGANLDLRPRRPRHAIRAPAILASPEGCLAKAELEQPKTVVSAPRSARDSSTLFSALRLAGVDSGRLLDLGCGPRDQAEFAAALGFDYFGIDLENAAADALADAQAIPVATGSIDVVFAYAVLEHLPNPWLGVGEVARVLGDDGWFVGSVSQGEPFHASYFHQTSWGLCAMLESAGFEVVRVWASYDTLRGLARMGQYPRVVRALLAVVAAVAERAPWLAPRAARDPRSRRLQELRRAASLCFLARRSPSATPAATTVAIEIDA